MTFQLATSTSSRSRKTGTGHRCVIRLSAMGDVALCTGVLARWHDLTGECFTIFTRKGFAPLFDNHPGVDRVVAVDEHVASFSAWWSFCREMAATYRDSGLLDLHGTLRSRILSLCWRGRVRRYPKYSLARRWLALAGVRFAAGTLARLRSLSVPQRYGLALSPDVVPAGELSPRFFLTERETEFGRTRLEPLRKGGKRLAVLHPFATHRAKQWPWERWRELVDSMEGSGWEYCFIGRDDSPAPDWFHALPARRNLVNALTLRQSMAAISAGDVMVTGDSGPLHLARGLRVPVVALFGPTDRAWGFYPEEDEGIALELDLDCRPCSLHGAGRCSRGLACLRNLETDTVLGAMERLVAGG